MALFEFSETRKKVFILVFNIILAIGMILILYLVDGSAEHIILLGAVATIIGKFFIPLMEIGTGISVSHDF
jgi:hypothetical protein